jgi:hypothetical protein
MGSCSEEELGTSHTGSFECKREKANRYNKGHLYSASSFVHVYGGHSSVHKMVSSK